MLVIRGASFRLRRDSVLLPMSAHAQGLPGADGRMHHGSCHAVCRSSGEMPMSAAPLLADGPFVTDGGLETDLLFHHGFDLPEFAAFPLRANPDWGAKMGYDRAALHRANREAVAFARGAQDRAGVDRSLVVGVHGPRGDGYVSGPRRDPDEAAEYHAVQALSFAAAGADLVHAMTLTTPEEGIGVVRAARSAGLPVAVSFTVETDGRLPDGTPLGTAVERVDAVAAPDWFGVNCAHPTHVARAFDGGIWQERIGGVRPNASTQTHEE